MASVNCEKLTTVQASSIVSHVYRTCKTHSNKDIKEELSSQNEYFENAAECRRQIRKMIRQLDAKKPPQRVKQDRKTVIGVNIPAPREGMSNEDVIRFFHKVKAEYEKKYHVVGGAIHVDEIHEYEAGEDHEKHMSRAHMHLLIVPEDETLGLNMKSFLNKARLHQMQDICNEICKDEFGYEYNDGTGKKSRKTVEQMKQESEDIAAQRTSAKGAMMNTLSEAVNQLPQQPKKKLFGKEDGVYISRDQYEHFANLDKTVSALWNELESGDHAVRSEVDELRESRKKADEMHERYLDLSLNESRKISEKARQLEADNVANYKKRVEKLDAKESEFEARVQKEVERRLSPIVEFLRWAQKYRPQYEHEKALEREELDMLDME